MPVASVQEGKFSLLLIEGGCIFELQLFSQPEGFKGATLNRKPEPKGRLWHKMYGKVVIADQNRMGAIDKAKGHRELIRGQIYQSVPDAVQ